MSLHYNTSLQPYNSFGLKVHARALGLFDSGEGLLELLAIAKREQWPPLLLGGGSNVLFLGDYPGLVMLNRIDGIELLEEDEHEVLLRAGAGVRWHSLVEYSVERNLGGLENLSLIPGLCGAAPMQNIGAYGMELCEVFEELEAIHLDSGALESFDREACRFGYRESVFKQELAGQLAILSITLRLQKKAELRLDYGAIREELQKRKISQPGIRDVSEAVMAIRRSKLPDPAQLGNAGSFFKNPTIKAESFEGLKEQYPAMPSYPLPSGEVKVPAGWLIEQCGWKGRRIGNTGAHKDQALVLVNYGGASGAEIGQLARDIQSSVMDRFGIALQPEVNIIGLES